MVYRIKDAYVKNPGLSGGALTPHEEGSRSGVEQASDWEAVGPVRCCSSMRASHGHTQSCSDILRLKTVLLPLGQVSAEHKNHHNKHKLMKPTVIN